MALSGLLVLAELALVCAGCAGLPEADTPLDVPPAEAVSAAIVVSYPSAQRACVELATESAHRVACVRTVREAFRAAVRVVDQAVDEDLAELAAREAAR
ncbi:hypothetical protein [Sorangium sp. So ce128]|uniref:hypothetical protein n=1 Tax=Sorangium sp. So ce128 TaxID=3133281 RepID=UPI003F5DBAA6